MQICTSTFALGKGTGVGPRGSPRKSRWVGDPTLRSRGRELGLHEVAGLSHQTHCDEDAERTEGEGGPVVAGGPRVRGPRRTPASRAPPALPNSSQSRSAPPGSPAGPDRTQRHHRREAVQDPARLGPLSQGKSREEVDGGGAEFQSSGESGTWKS